MTISEVYYFAADAVLKVAANTKSLLHWLDFRLNTGRRVAPVTTIVST